MSARGAEDAGENREGLRAGVGTRAERYFAGYDRSAEGTFGMIIGWRHTWASKEGEEFSGVTFGRDESVAEIDGLRVGEKT